jgi:hypothetical protein
VNDYPSLSREARGLLRYLHRKIHLPDDWTNKGTPAEAWDAKTSPPTLNWHRFDLTFASIAVAMMAEVTPAWREVYADILDDLARRMTTYWAWHDWIEQRGEDPQRGNYPPAYLQLLIPPGYAGKYNVPGWAGNGMAPHPFEPDPIATSGALYYKGFFNFVIGLYEYDRRGTESAKWARYGPHVLPLWVADMDFASPPAVIEALRARVEHGLFGYGYKLEVSPLHEVFAERLAKRYSWRVSPEAIVMIPRRQRQRVQTEWSTFRRRREAECRSHCH